MVLRCRANHFAYPRGYKEERVRLNVLYPPKPEKPKAVTSIEKNQKTYVTTTIRANPKPTIFWILSNESRIHENTRYNQYEASSPRRIGRGRWNITLIISHDAIEDTKTQFHVIARNPLGSQKYVIKLQKQTPVIFDFTLIAIFGGALASGLGVIVLLYLLAVIRKHHSLTQLRRTATKVEDSYTEYRNKDLELLDLDTKP